MHFFFQKSSLSIVLLLLTVFCPVQGFAAAPALAILSQLEGSVEAGRYKKMKAADNGTMLWRKHRVKTGDDGKTSVLFTDGSRVRMFAFSEMGIANNITGTSRWARFKLLLHSGSMWFKVARGDKKVELALGNLRMELSDVTVRITRKKNGTDISVIQGVGKVLNRSSSVVLKSGQRLYQVNKNDFLPHKVSLMPNQLTMSLTPSKIAFSNHQSQELTLKLGVKRFGRDQTVRRKGPVLLSSDYYHLELPKKVQLNNDGTAEVKLFLKPPASEDRTFDHSVHIHAMMDQRGLDDVQDGRLSMDISSPDL